MRKDNPMEMQKAGRDETEMIWMQAIAEEWQEELADPREGICKMESRWKTVSR